MLRIGAQRFLTGVGNVRFAFSSIANRFFIAYYCPAWKGGVAMNPNNSGIRLLNTYALTDCKNEQEEYPGTVTNSSGKSWIVTLRRLAYPDDREVIAFYHKNGEGWSEKGLISSEPGYFETPVAACLKNGEPLVAWTGIKGGRWGIYSSIMSEGEFSKPEFFLPPSGRAINPKVIAGYNNQYFLVWECYYKRAFSIYLNIVVNGVVSEPKLVTEGKENCFDPAVAQAIDGSIYLVYGTTEGVHQNIEMTILNGKTLSTILTLPVAVGGGRADRVNLNTKPAVAFDAKDRVWISWENNRDTIMIGDDNGVPGGESKRSASEGEFGDNYTGGRICSMVCFKDGKFWEQADAGRWLFTGENDHLPTFVKDTDNNLYLFTLCGGDFQGEPFWKFRVSYLHPETGWTKPKFFFRTEQKGQTSVPSVIFSDDKFYLAWRYEESKISRRDSTNEPHIKISEFSVPEISGKYVSLKMNPAVVEEFHPVEGFFPLNSGRPRLPRRTMNYNGEEYTLLVGCLHEHSEGSLCWPAGTDGTLHDDYRFGLFSEGYDFVGMTDHPAHIDEPWWRKNLRIADFYSDEPYFVAIPALEYGASPPKGFTEIPAGVGHRNVIFASAGDARKFIKSSKEIYSHHTPESDTSVKMWDLIRSRNVECVAIPHHIADQNLVTSWQVRDEELEPVIELFQSRGNSEYPGCPKENNQLSIGEHSTSHREAFADFALREKKYKFGFIGGGDHNNMGVGLAALWVKEISRRGIIEALKSRRCYATTGDKIFLDFRINGALFGETVKNAGVPELTFNISTVQTLKSIEILRNSRVIETVDFSSGSKTHKGTFRDVDYLDEKDVLYYYLRVTQENNHMAWSSPVWVEKG